MTHSLYKMWLTSVNTLCGVIILLTCFMSARSDFRKARLVQTLQGPVRGYKDLFEDVFIFYGIPYATAPTGENKFKPPEPGPVWLSTFKAVNNKIVCPQIIPPGFEIFFLILQMKEDCLITNVYIPNTNDTNIPVVVYVHGGAFQNGFGSFLEPKKLVATKKVIAVTFNYRLGAHGFLCLGTEDVPGNAGLKDQVALLRWVKYNIASFGGNPSDVTIAGYSAGSASVDLIMLSPAANGLFNKVIPESGGNLAAFAMQTRPVENAKTFARRFNVSNVDNICDLEKFYKTASLKTLTSDKFPDRMDSTYLFSPCVERITGKGSFLNDSPYNILKTDNYKKVPMLYGFDNLEGLLRVGYFETWKDAMNSNFSDFLPTDLQFINSAEKDEVANQIKKFYFGDKKVSRDTILGYVDFFSDIALIYPMIRAVELHVSNGHQKLFLYEYSFFDNNTAVVPYTNVRGATHGAQTNAVFDSIGEIFISKEYKKMKKIMRDLWGNFIRTSTPVPEGSTLPAWPPTGVHGSPYMSLNRTVELRSSVPLQERMGLWHDIYAKYYLPPMPPSFELLPSQLCTV